MNELLGRRMRDKQVFEHEIVDELAEYCRVRAVHTEGSREVGCVGGNAPTLDGPRVANEIEVGVGLPALSGEPGAAVLGRHIRIGASIRVREHRIGILVHRRIRVRAASGDGCPAGGRRIGPAATASNGRGDEYRQEC